MSDIADHFNLLRGLIQEAKGVEGPGGGFVTDHLDAAEWHVDEIEKAISQIRADQKERDIIAVRDAMVAMEWPPQDGDRQIDEVIAAIREQTPMTQTNPLQADAVVEQAQKIIIDWAEPWVADWLSKHGSFPPGLHMPLYVVQDLLAKAHPIPLQGGDDVRADIPEGWRVYTVDASIEGRWRVKLKGPDRDYPAEEDWPAHRGPAYVCQVGHDLASGIAACVTEIRKLKEASDVD